MKKLSLPLMAAFVLLFAACSSQPKAEDKPAETVAAPAAAAEPAKPAFTPYKAVMVIHTVQNFDKWKEGFDKDEPNRTKLGLTDPGVGRGLDNDKLAIVLSKADDIAKAKEAVASPQMKENMKKAGVTSAPVISFVDVIYDDTTSIPQKERLMVTHHVKDFATWKKAFDSESAEARAANGMVERAMAQSVDDPNTVTILFAVTDMAKAKARVNAPELKKMMTDAGVDGPPTITWFKWVQM